jgi:hypothetical protein
LTSSAARSLNLTAIFFITLRRGRELVVWKMWDRHCWGLYSQPYHIINQSGDPASLMWGQETDTAGNLPLKTGFEPDFPIFPQTFPVGRHGGFVSET